MINAKDLMLDNLVLAPDGRVMQIEGLKDGALWGKWVDRNVTFDQNFEAAECNPIPITPELMRKVGWHIERRTDIYTIYRGTEGILVLVKIREGEEVNALMTVVQETRHETVFICTTLHELQNMYRWETGKHLEVNL